MRTSLKFFKTLLQYLKNSNFQSFIFNFIFLHSTRSIMISCHTMSSSKSRRLDPLIKSSVLRSVVFFRVKQISYFQFSQSHFLEDRSIVEQFRVHREINDKDNPFNETNEKGTRRRISYIREQKLRAISYATITWIKQKDEFMRLISKYAAAKILDITSVMLRIWLKTQHEIESSSSETRKNRATNILCQESELKARLTAEFNQVRKSDRKIIKRWFVRHAKDIYDQLYSHRVMKQINKMTEYIDFRFSQGCFVEYKKRHRICVKIATKVTQKIKFHVYRICLHMTYSCWLTRLSSIFVIA
jgi:hypothetical protein